LRLLRRVRFFVSAVPEPNVPRLIDLAADVWLALRAIGTELERWDRAPRSGRIFINGVASMATADTIDIPDNDVPARVDWADRLGGQIAHDKTATTWSAEDASGAPSAAVTITPDTDSDDETATVTFNASTGQFKVVATTQGAAGEVRAESALYNIVPGAAAVGTITVQA
jgi:hypothetical protein